MLEKAVIRGNDPRSGTDSNACSRLRLPMTTETTPKGERLYNTSLVMYVASEEEEGLYNLYFHNCQNYNCQNNKKKDPLLVDFTVRLIGGWSGEIGRSFVTLTERFLS